MEHPLREVGAFEAKNKLGQLLDIVEQGEEVIITRHGKEVARLVPVRPVRDREQARAAIQRIKSESAQLSASSVPSTGRSGNLTGTKVARESRARQFGDACVDLQ